MISNYTKDASLLDYEILDYDTTESNETGINSGRMRLPTRYDIAKYYQRAVRNSVARRKEDRDVLDREGNTVSFRKGQKLRRNKGEYGKWVDKENPIDFSSDFEWQITYSFPSTIRNNKTENGATYGGKNVTYRRLYLILCEHFNGGDFFIDDYFENVYPYTIKPEIDDRLDMIKADLIEAADFMFSEVNSMNEAEGLADIKINKNGKLSASARKINRRAYRALSDYERFAKEWELSEGEEVARRIKEDIISCVESGQLACQLFSAPADSTQAKRLAAGLGKTPLFSATGKLIENIQLYVKIGGNGKWETQSGLLV